jgi:glyoxylase-like metal-dependent hydrolase (beta-lactamase superfamily II)
MSLEQTTDLGEGILHFRSPQWQTNCLVGIKDDTAVVVDPAWTREEVRRIRRAAESAGGPIHFLLTHADLDHTCGMFAFPDATVYAEPVSKELVLNGGAKAQLDTQGPDWGMEFETDLRVDEVVEPGTALELGPFVIETHEAHGHIMDGLAYVFVNERVLVPGDYLSASMCPVVWSSVTDFIDTTERLCEVLESSDLRWVVPGHGPLLCPADAIEIGRADVTFLRQIRNAAASAKEDELPWAHAMVRVLAVDVPRRSSLDIEIYAPHVLIARRALIELGIHKPGEEPAEWG